jgi:tetratricopeptide (TPR) repeat protein
MKPLVLACALVAFVAADVAAADAPARRILVMPFDNVTRDAKIFWLTEAASVVLTDDLNALGANAIPREERIEAFAQLQVPPVASLTDATMIRLGQLVGAAEVVVGSLQLENDALAVHARSITLDAGRMRIDTTERGPVDELFTIFERIARRVAPASNRPLSAVEAQHPPLGTFEDYVKGLLAETPATAIGYLTAALAAQPTYDRARLALWDAYTDQGEFTQALAVAAAVPPDSPLAHRARFLAGLSEIELKKYDEAFGNFEALTHQSPSATAFNNLGVVQLRRGATPQTAKATYYFNQARETDPSDPDYFFNLGYAYFEDRDVQAAIYWLREAARRNPADGEAHFVLGAALMAAGNSLEAGREKELARRLSSTFAQWERRPAPEQVPKGLERVKQEVELPHAGQVEAALAASEQRDQQALARFYLDRGRRLFQQERDREAMAELNRALYLSPYMAEAHLLVGRIHLRSGRIRDAIDALKIALFSGETADAHAVLAEAYLAQKDTTAARAEADRALALDPASADAKRVAAALK